MFGQAFFSDFISNLLATIIGVILGLPLAFWLDRVVRSRNVKERENEKNERVNKILSLLELELEENENAINRFHEDISNNFFPVRVESWNAFSDGGELQWLNDPDLLATLSTTYATVNQYHFMYEKYVHASLFPNSVGSPEQKKKVYFSVANQREITKKQIVSCLETIKKKQLPKHVTGAA